MASLLCICCTPVWVSPTREGSIFIAISNASACIAILCCVNGNLICGIIVAKNHSLCCYGGISKLTWPINILNRWFSSHTDSIDACLISFSSIIHYDSDFGFLNSTTKALLISLNVAFNLLMDYFIYHFNALSLTSSSLIYLSIHTALAMNQTLSGSSIASPLKIGSLMCRGSMGRGGGVWGGGWMGNPKDNLILLSSSLWRAFRMGGGIS